MGANKTNFFGRGELYFKNDTWHWQTYNFPINGLIGEYGYNLVKNPALAWELRLKLVFTETGFTYNACGPFTKNKERIQKLKETR